MMECDLLDREKKSFNSILEFLRITCILPAASSYEYITNILKRLAAISISMLADIVCRDESSIDVVFDRPHVLHRSIILNALTNFQQGPDGQVVVEKLEV
ncbi:hypothetical protein EON65_34385 [archaeon]|nr:MAG: hypothetical protein EON65_34385 [archaeon]